MNPDVRPIPEGYHSVTPYLAIKGAAAAIEYHKRAFSAKEIFRMSAPGGTIGHAEIQIGDSRVMLADEFPGMGFSSPRTVGGTPVNLMVYVENVDEVYDRAVREGARVKQPVKNQFYGDRSGALEDPFGHVWHIATHVEEVPMDELKRRSEAAMAEMAKA